MRIRLSDSKAPLQGLTDKESRLLAQLRSNRKIALETAVPADMKDELARSVYPDHHLKWIAHETLKWQAMKHGSAAQFLASAVNTALAIKGFELRLEFRHGINPQEIADIMLRGIAI